MRIAELLTTGRVVCNGVATSKQRVLQWLGELLAADQPTLTAASVFDSLDQRERLGSTGLGQGIALPHGRLPHDQFLGAFIRLKRGVAFDALDGDPVDLVFGLLVPEQAIDEHLRILAYLGEMFSDAAFCAELRAATTSAALLERLQRWQPPGGWR